MAAVPVLTVEPAVQSTRTFRHVLSVIARDPLSLVSTIVIILFIIIAIFAMQVAPSPAEGAGKTNVSQRMLPPSLAHPLGTDRLGRDMLSRVIVGSRPALIIPIGVVFFAILIGAPLGALAGYKGGWLDEVIMRITDMFLAFPSLLLAMAITAALGRGMRNAAIALVISWWPWYTRLVRGVTLSLRERYFIEAAQATGVRDSVIILRHILPSRHRDPGDGRSWIPRPGHPTPLTGLGLDGCRGPRFRVEPVVDLHFCRPGDLHRRPCIQSAGRHPAGYL